MGIPLRLWDVKNNRAQGKSAEAQKINLAIDRIRVDVNRRYQELLLCYCNQTKKRLSRHWSKTRNVTKTIRTAQR